jgi:hypothetical protein
LTAHAGWLTKGWTLYPIVSYRTGFPLDVMAFSPGTASSIDADLVAPIQYYSPGVFRTVAGNSAGGNYWFDPNSFSNLREKNLNQEAMNVNPATLLNQFTYGDFGRNSLRGPGAFNVNLSLSKIFRVREKADIELRGDAFNLFNSAQFGNPDTNIGDPNFGQISSTADPRIVQVALHLKF